MLSLICHAQDLDFVELFAGGAEISSHLRKDRVSFAAALKARSKQEIVLASGWPCWVQSGHIGQSATI